MDIRDLKGLPVPVVPDNQRVEYIFKLQQELLDAYSIIEKMPPIPFDLDIKPNQILIKDFISRIVEEVGEGYESLVRLENLSKVQVNRDMEKASWEDACINMIQNFNEEIADAIHFLIETMIVSGLQPPYIHRFITNKLGDNELVVRNAHGKEDDLLASTYMVGSKVNYDKMFLNIGHDVTGGYMADEMFLKGGRVISSIFLERFSVLAWEFTYHLMIARNALKNKAWKQTEMTTDHNVYYNEIAESWLSLIRLCEYSGIDDKAFFHLYYKKNRINLFRIKSKY